MRAVKSSRVAVQCRPSCLALRKRSMAVRMGKSLAIKSTRLRACATSLLHFLQFGQFAERYRRHYIQPESRRGGDLRHNTQKKLECVLAVILLLCISAEDNVGVVTAWARYRRPT